MLGGTDPTRIIDSDGCRSYDGLVELGYKKDFRISTKGITETSNESSQIKEIKHFWGYARTRFVKLSLNA